ncbi:hypothetical protein CesoFtcFv8_025524 [Champsocephalus esox]|uniref:G-protein coupled receptors family 1 profile domain-containing protein n=1 Tax=Champsocephalus esox TaxID=159716 RepID=A0AAN8B462_9TELE|nr:hypothetical protein CesoFtcFv8_025524 [Champsocephalus esox]
MESTPVEIFKEENKCLSTLLDDCPVNSSAWVSGYSESRNVTRNDSWEAEHMSPIIPIITAVYSVVFVVSLLGNCLVMYVIIRYTKMKTATNIYIFNLALADALITTTMPFQSTDYLLNTWPFR